jgi:hypothetical protein
MGQPTKSTKSEGEMIRLEDDESIRTFAVAVAVQYAHYRRLG